MKHAAVCCVEHTAVVCGWVVWSIQLWWGVCVCGACRLAVAEGQCSHWVLWLCLLQVQSVDVAAFNKI